MTDRVIPASAPAGAPGDPAIEPSVRLIPLGGLGEIGLNMMLLESGEDLLAVDCGLMFPDDEMPGVDYVIPDFSYLLARREQVRGVVLTHGHEDHIGALPYLLREFDVPVYGTPLTLALAGERLREHGLLERARLVPVEPRRAFDVGGFRVEPIRVTHSIADGIGSASRRRSAPSSTRATSSSTRTRSTASARTIIASPSSASAACSA